MEGLKDKMPIKIKKGRGTREFAMFLIILTMIVLKKLDN